MDILSPAKACDPWAVYLATQSRETAGITGAEGLTGLQQEIFGFIKDKGRVTGEELIARFSIKEAELHTHLATLRHCELVKGRKEGNTVYLVPFDSGD